MMRRPTSRFSQPRRLITGTSTSTSSTSTNPTTPSTITSTTSSTTSTTANATNPAKQEHPQRQPQLLREGQAFPQLRRGDAARGSQPREGQRTHVGGVARQLDVGRIITGRG
jgi:hypothetical protein